MENETLYKFFAGLTSEAEKKAIKLWLEEDALNHQLLLKERELYDAVMLADERLLTTKHRFLNRYKGIVKRTIKWAAVLLIAFISNYLFFNVKYSAFENAVNTVTVPLGQRVNLTLSDGTKVCLNAGSIFTYPSLFGGDVRQGQLNGEAFFEVVSVEKKPFVVHTHLYDIEVLGTKFNVDASRHSFSAALMEGKIKVKDNIHFENVVHLSPNHKVTALHDSLFVSDISDYDIYRWKEGLICFEDLNFVDLMKRLEKYYGVKLIIETSSLSKYSFSGKFRISDGIENLLRVLQKDVNYQYTRSEDGNIIYIK